MDANLGIIITARDAASATMRQISGQAKTMADTLQSIGSMMALSITTPIVGIGGAMLKMSMDAVESENLFAVSMKGMTGEARNWSNEMSKALGLNSYELRKSVSMFNTMFNSMGLGERAALDMSEGLTALAHDMASFYNLSPDVAFQKLRAGVMGESEPLKQLGIVVNETTTKMWAMENGLIKAGQEMSEAQKVVARYGLIMQSTSDAQGDLARTLDSPANALRRMRAQFEEVAISAGQVFLPEVSRALSWINNEGIPRVQAALETFKGSWGSMSDEARNKVLLIAGLFVGGGPLLLGLGMAYKAVVALGTAFTALRLRAVAEIVLIWRAAYELSNTFKSLANALSTGQFGVPADQYESWGDQVQRVSGDIVGLVGGIDSLDGAMQAMGITGISAFDDIVKAVSKTMVDMPKYEDLVAAWRQSGNSGTPFLANLVSNYEAVNNVIIRAAGTIQAQAPALQIAQNEWDNLAGAVDGAKVKMQTAAQAMGIGASEIISYLVSIDPAAQMAAAGVETLKLRIVGLEDGLEAMQEGLKGMQKGVQAAQAVLSGLQNEASRVSAALSEAKQRLAELSSPRLTGMGEMEDQLAVIEMAIKRMKAQELGVDVSKFLPSSDAGRAFLASLPTNLKELEKMLEKLQLTKDLSFTDALRELKKAAEDAKPEMTFEQALAAIKATRGEIGGLESQAIGLRAAIEGQQAAIAGMQQAMQDYQENMDGMSRSIQDARKELALAEERQDTTKESLTEYYKWLIETKPKVTELGGEWLLQAGIIDEKARAMLDATRIYAEGETEAAIAAMRAMVKEYQDSMGALGVLGNDVQVPVRTSSQSGDSQSPTVVNVYVAGSVTTERELVRSFREELIKLGKRNVSVGLA